MENYEIKIGWLYPDLMSTYGDYGNIKALVYRAQQRKINIEVIKISLNQPADLITKVDILFMGGAQDEQQEIVSKDLLGEKGKLLIKALTNGVPGLFICGAYQFLGNYYLTAEGKKIPGLNFFDLYTQNPGVNSKRLIGNVVIRTRFFHDLVVGFENHGGRTYLKNKDFAFAQVIAGFGNNGEDKTEGMVWKNAVGTYLHGPLLPKNPLLTDYFLRLVLERKYQKKIILKKLNDLLEFKAREVMLKKLTLK